MTAQTIYELFNQLNREMGLTTLIVSHDPGIARHVHRVVAIRDGKLATETVRSRANGAAGFYGDENEDGEVDEVFEELTVLDSAGRLQIPKEYLMEFGIKGRARLEIREDGILILPADEVHQDRVQNAESLVTGFEEAKKSRGLSGLVNRLMRGDLLKRKGE
jgi:ABC-type multidrug transport system ATPase subunit